MNYLNNADLGDLDGNAMVPHFNDDHVVMGLQAGTHWGALGHVSYDHHLYNGVPADTVTALGGSTVLGIENVRTLVGRGVLLDVAAMHGVDQLPGGHEITEDELDETAEWAGVEIRSGDIVLIRSGRIRSFHQGGGLAYIMGPEGDASNPGPGIDAPLVSPKRHRSRCRRCHDLRGLPGSRTREHVGRALSCDRRHGADHRSDLGPRGALHDVC